MSNKINILLADDHQLFREGMVFLLQNCDFAGDIREATNGREVLNELKKFQPHIILMDIEMPEMNGIDASRECSRLYPDINIIALSMYANEEFYSDMIDAGAKGFLLKNSRFEDVRKAIIEVEQGNNYFSPEILHSIISNLNQKSRSPQHSPLSQREIEVLFNICKGLSSQEIGESLFISKRTVEKHRENIMLKTECKNTAQLVVYAIKNRYFEV